MINDATAIAIFSVGLSATLTLLLVSSRRMYRIEHERMLMLRMRRRLRRLLLNQKS